MCLAVPMKIVEVTGKTALVEQEGVTRNIRVDFISDAAPGEYVLVHAGIAIERVDAEEAAETLRLIKELTDALH
ncbi:MAG TPA: HypC/HybG/HupF family hydrogenase formation chaperone [Armatimonadota bacterium]|jgi:hydrogenase expression/formation protein HypC